MENVTFKSNVSLLSFLTMFVIGTDTFVIAPLLPTLSQIFGIKLSISGWMISAYALGYAVCALIAGPISDFFDRRKVLLSGLLAFIVTTCLCGFSQGFWTMIIFRFLAGVSAAFVSPQIWASIPLLVKKEYVVRTMGAATAGLAIAQVVGIPIGSYLAVIVWPLPFWAITFISVILFLVLNLSFPSLPSHIKDKKFSIIKIYSDLIKNSTLKMYMLGYLIFQTGNFEAISFFGSWLHKDYSMDLPAIGKSMMIIGLGNAIGSLYGTRLVKYIGLSKSLLCAYILLILLYSVASFSWSAETAVISLSLIMMVAGFAFALFMSKLQSQAEGARGTVSSLANACMYIGAAVGGGIGGVLLTNFPKFFGVAGFTIICYVISLFIYAKAGAFGRMD